MVELRKNLDPGENLSQATIGGMDFAGILPTEFFIHYVIYVDQEFYGKGKLLPKTIVNLKANPVLPIKSN